MADEVRRHEPPDRANVLRKQGGDLWLVSDGQARAATAEEILTLSRSSEPIGEGSGTLGTVAFMSRRLSVSLLVRVADGKLKLEPSVMYRGQRHAVNREFDHVLLGSIWFPLERESWEAVVDWIDQHAPDGTLPVASYAVVSSAILAGIDVVEELDVEQLRRQVGHVMPPEGLVADLYSYQETGFAWLTALHEAGLGGVLGDEMGLGKTLQVIALLAELKQRGEKPSLVIVPLTLIPNWVRELTKFAPSLSVTVHQGASRVSYFKPLLEFDVVLTTYETLVADIGMLSMVEWVVVAADEAQAIKNPDTQRSQAAREIPRQTAIAITGTPVENRALDLWSIGEFAVPGLLGSRSEFEVFLENAPQQLQRLARTFVLRREVDEVAHDLPDRVDIDEALDMLESEAVAYESLRTHGLASSGRGNALAMLTKLRQFTAHPSLVLGQDLDPLISSAKFFRLYELLSEILAEGKKAIVFSAFHGSSDLIAWLVRQRLSRPAWILDGRVPSAARQTNVDEFSAAAGGAVLVANPTTGGVGLNITAAQHVIHYTLEWNPAREDQATARAHRRGQTSRVFVHRLFYTNCVDELMAQRLATKRDLFGQVIQPTDEISVDELARLLAASPIDR